MPQYPLIPVPQALRTVLTVTASTIVRYPLGTERIPTSGLIGKSCAEGRDDTNTQRICPIPVTGRISARTIRAPKEGFPSCDISIINGYAIDINAYIKSTSNEGGRMPGFMEFKVTNLPSVADDLTPFMTVQVLAGAPIPTSLNVVISRREVEEVSPHFIRVHSSVLRNAKIGDGVRSKASDMEPHAIIISKGDMIDIPHVGLLTQLGKQSVMVNCIPRVAILSPEMQSDDSSFHSYYTSDDGFMNQEANGPVLCSLLSSYGNCYPMYTEFHKHANIEDQTSLFKEKILYHDVVITTAFDNLQEMLVKNLGCAIIFGGLIMKPSKRVLFLTCRLERVGQTKLIFVLPSYSASGMVASELFVRPCLDMIHRGVFDDVPNMVHNAMVHAEIEAPLMNSVKLDPHRPEYHRVNLTYEADGKGAIQFKAFSTGIQRPSRLMSMCDMSGLMILPKGKIGSEMRTQVGDSYPVLLGMSSGMKLKESCHHLGDSFIIIGILEVLGSQTEDAYKRTKIISRSGKKPKSLRRRILNSLDEGQGVVIEAKQSKDAYRLRSKLRRMGKFLDVIFIICTDTTFQENLDIAFQLQSLLHKNIPSMATRARNGAVNDSPLAALFEPIAGYSIFDNETSLLVSVPNVGIEGAVENLKHLLTPSLLMARGHM